MPGHDNKTFGASGTSLSNLPSAALTALGGRANIDAATIELCLYFDRILIKHYVQIFIYVVDDF